MIVKTSNNKKNNKYEIYYQKDFDLFFDILKNRDYKRIMIATDTRVAKNYLKSFEKQVYDRLRIEPEKYVIDPGLRNKNEKNYLDLIRRLREKNFDKDDLVIAMGGCAINAICNFTSSTYMGGIDYVHIPTTLSSMVNGTVSNVCAINLLTYQNTLFSYATPLFVYTNVSLLKTLPEHEYAKGIVNSIKLAITNDKSFFDFIYNNKEKLRMRDEDILIKHIELSNELRNDIRKKPGTLTLIEGEGFGLTFYEGYNRHRTIFDNEAQVITFGIVKGLELSDDLNENEADKIKKLLDFFGMKTSFKIPKILQERIIHDAIKYNPIKSDDNKRTITMVLLKSIGFCYKKTFKTDILLPQEEKRELYYKGNSLLKYFTFGILSLLLIFIDQFTKWKVASTLSDGTILSFCRDMLEILYYENQGAAFGILQGQHVLFTILTIIVVFLIIGFMYKMPFTKTYRHMFAFSTLLFAGTLGNFIDRVRLGYVVDFIYLKNINFPIFNFADCYITIACIIMFYGIMFVYQEKDFDFITKK